jgi:catechol 2,3-dioxygenase-like lactoylglutathione lyase family enzyme
MKTSTTLRVARPTDRLGEVIRFYRDGVGLVEVVSFHDHEGFGGVMLGTPGASYHLEFTQQTGHVAGLAPSQENLLVFYLAAREEWQAAVDRMVGAGYAPVASYNPYWDQSGCTFEDPDGYRVVFQNASWPD